MGTSWEPESFLAGALRERPAFWTFSGEAGRVAARGGPIRCEARASKGSIRTDQRGGGVSALSDGGLWLEGKPTKS